MSARIPSTNPDPSEFEPLYRQHQGFVWQTLRGLGVMDAAIDDAVQDVFLVVHRRLPTFEARASVRTWLYEIVRRIAWRYRTRAQRDASRLHELPELRGEHDLDAEVDKSRAFEVLRTFTTTLDDDRLRVFMLSEFGQLRGREIAEALGVNLNTVYARLRSAHQQLDRLTTRLRARESGALLAVARRSRPTPVASRRTWAAIAMHVGASGSTAALLAGGGVARLGLGWLAIGAAASGLGLGAVLWLSPPAPPSASPVAPATLAAAPGGSPSPSPAPSGRPPPPNPVPPAALASTSAGPTRPARSPQPDPDHDPPPPVSRAPSSPGPALAREVALVQEIRGALGDDSSMTAGLRRYAAAYPQGVLRPEVDALAIEHACTRGRDVDRAFTAFARRWPRSTLIDHLRAACPEQIGPQKPRGAQIQSL